MILTQITNQSLINLSEMEINSIYRIITSNSNKDSLLMKASKSPNSNIFTYLLSQDNIDFSYKNMLGNDFLHELIQNYNEQCNENIYRIIDRVSMLPIDKIDVNATNNDGLTFYWLLNSKTIFDNESTLEKIQNILKIDTNIGQKTETGDKAYIYG